MNVLTRFDYTDLPIFVKRNMVLVRQLNLKILQIEAFTPPGQRSLR